MIASDRPNLSRYRHQQVSLRDSSRTERWIELPYKMASTTWP